MTPVSSRRRERRRPATPRARRAPVRVPVDPAGADRLRVQLRATIDLVFPLERPRAVIAAVQYELVRRIIDAAPSRHAAELALLDLTPAAFHQLDHPTPQTNGDRRR